jgi:hypothetical protein
MTLALPSAFRAGIGARCSGEEDLHVRSEASDPLV